MLRKSKARTILNSSIDSALLAVEVYNKPRASFRTEAYISLMIIAWTRLFHAYFHHQFGEKYFYKKKNSNRYEIIDGERKAWDLRTCIKRYGLLAEPEKANLNFFIKLRNKIEHRHIEKRELDILLFGECQALLINYEYLLVSLFGAEFALNENLAYSLQFSAMRTEKQREANKRALSADMAELKKFVEMYRSVLPQEVFDSQAYSIKLIQVPKISNTDRNEAAIEFVRWDSLSEADQELYSRLGVIIKDKIVKKPVVNLGAMKPSLILELVKKQSGVRLSHYDHRCLYMIFGIRPTFSDDGDPFETKPEYCNYDEVHGDYVYYQAWADFLIMIIEKEMIEKDTWREAFKQGRTYDLASFEE